MLHINGNGHNSKLRIYLTNHTSPNHATIHLCIALAVDKHMHQHVHAYLHIYIYIYPHENDFKKQEAIWPLAVVQLVKGIFITVFFWVINKSISPD